MWTVAVPKQREISPLTPYDKAMSVQELLEELVCVRLDQDFQLHKLEQPGGGGGGGSGGNGGGNGGGRGGGGGGGGSGLSLRDEQTYFLSHGMQIQRITFVQEQEAPIARGPLSSVSCPPSYTPHPNGCPSYTP